MSALYRFVLVCPGMSDFVHICPTLSRSVPVCPFLPRSVRDPERAGSPRPARRAGEAGTNVRAVRSGDRNRPNGLFRAGLPARTGSGPLPNRDVASKAPSGPVGGRTVFLGVLTLGGLCSAARRVSAGQRLVLRACGSDTRGRNGHKGQNGLILSADGRPMSCLVTRTRSPSPQREAVGA
jgi:hypothetical protein